MSQMHSWEFSDEFWAIVEATNSWLKRFRKLYPRYEKMLQSFRDLLTLATATTILNKVMVIYP